MLWTLSAGFAGLPLGAQTVRVVKDNPGACEPFDTWANAASNIQQAIDYTGTIAGAIVLVSNGVYDTGGYGTLTTNRVYINKPITVRSLSGPSNTCIVGRWNVPGGDPFNTNDVFGPSAVRCVYLASGASLIGFTLTNGATYISPFAYGYGGGAYCETTNAFISNCVFTANAASTWGGGVYRGTLRNCILAGNTVNTNSGNGGGARDSLLYDCEITGNTARNAGGACSSTLYNCIVRGNSAYQGGGTRSGSLYAGVFSGNSATYGGVGYGNLVACGCLITGNYAAVAGGLWGPSSVYNCTFAGNSARYAGGIQGAGATVVYNSFFFNNTADVYGGGSTMDTSYNCTVAGNYCGPDEPAVNGGGGVRGGTHWNAIVYHNSAANAARSNYWGPSNFNYSCTAPLPSGPANTDANPLFADPASGNFRLTRISPCFNSGLKFGWMADPATNECLRTDLDGGPRIRHNAVDRGAFELRVPRGSMFTVD